VNAQEPQPGIDLQRLEKLQRGVQYAATLALLVTLGLFAFAWWRLAGINRELDTRQAMLTTADEELKKREGRIADLDAQIKVIEKRLETANATMRAIELPAAPPVGAGGVPTVTRQVPARVYIQIFDEAQRSRARELQKALESRMFVVPGIENVGARVRPQSASDVRFYGGATDMSDIASIRDVASQFGVTLKEIVLKPSTGVRPRHYEVWLGNDFR
jgi:hypothetical protein